MTNRKYQPFQILRNAFSNAMGSDASVTKTPLVETHTPTLNDIANLIHSSLNEFSSYTAPEINAHNKKMIDSFNTVYDKISSIQNIMEEYFAEKNKQHSPMDRFTSQVYHDLANIINSASFQIEIITEYFKNPSAPIDFVLKYIDNLKLNLIRAFDFCNSSLSSSDKTLNNVVFCLGSLVNSLISSSLDFLKTNVSVIPQTPAADTMVSGNKTEIEKILINLIVNARDAILECNDPELMLRVNYGRHESFVFVSVFNAISKPLSSETMTKIKNILNPEIVTSQETFTTKSTGKGLGLGIIRDCVIKNNGRLTFDCNETNVTMTFSMPASNQ